MFEHLRRSDPLALNEFVSTRLRIVSGEITEERFGLTPQDFHQLATEVDLIINVAASVNFSSCSMRSPSSSNV